MKLATIDDGSRDGSLVVVDAAAARVAPVPEIGRSLQAVLDDWDACEPKLRAAARQLAAGDRPGSRPFASVRWLAPLPRAYQVLDGGGYLPHLELGYVRRKQQMPEEMKQAPIFYQSVSDSLLGPQDDIVFAGSDLGVDFEAELAVVTGDVPQGTGLAQAGAGIRLLALMNDITLRFPQRVEFARGFGFYHCKPKKAFAPFVVTPDELGPAWDGQLLDADVHVHLNGRPFGRPNAARDSLFGFATLVSHASRHRALAAGTLIAGGTVSNADRSLGQCCIHERRVLDAIATGEEQTPFMQPGDRVRIEVLLADGTSPFGCIDQTYREAAWAS